MANIPASPLDLSTWYRFPSAPYLRGSNPYNAFSPEWLATTDFDNDTPGFLYFLLTRSDLSAPGTVDAYIARTGGKGPVSAIVRTNSTTGAIAMTANSHFNPVTEVVSFADQEVGVKKVSVQVTSSPGAGLHTFTISMDTPTGGAVIRIDEMHVYYNQGGVNPSATIVDTSAGLQTALDTASPGDLICARDTNGVYTRNTRPSGRDVGGFYAESSGTRFAPIILTNYPGEEFHIKQNYAQNHDQSGEGNTAGIVLNCDYFRLFNAKISECLGSGVMKWSAPLRPVIENCEIWNVGNPPGGVADYVLAWHADNLGATLLDGSFKAIYRFNHFHDIYDPRATSGQENPWNEYPGGGHSGIHGFYQEEAIVHHNLIERVAKGVFQKNPDDTDGLGHFIFANVFKQITEAGVVLFFAGAGQPGANHVHVFECLFDCTATGSENCYGINAEMPEGESTAAANDLWFHSNTKIGGAEIFNGGDIDNIVAYNNVLSGCSATMTFTRNATANNLAYCDFNCYSGGTFRVMTQRYVNTQTYNGFQAFRDAYPSDAALKRAVDANSITTAPTFADAANDDYRMLTGVTIGTGRFGQNMGAKVAATVYGIAA